MNNVKEMYDTLVAIRESHEKCETGHDVLVVRTIDKALAEPPRNCDVGTPDEWYERHSKWCANERRKDCAATMCRKCFADFLNKPYQKEGGAV